MFKDKGFGLGTGYLSVVRHSVEVTAVGKADLFAQARSRRVGSLAF
ncbi:hypothetical protein [Dendronalium sp. ChiSLP03b]